MIGFHKFRTVYSCLVVEGFSLMNARFLEDLDSPFYFEQKCTLRFVMEGFFLEASKVFGVFG